MCRWPWHTWTSGAGAWACAHVVRAFPPGSAQFVRCLAVSGPVERVITLETGQAGREENMRAFAAALLRLAAQALD